MSATPTPWKVQDKGLYALVKDGEGKIVAARHRLPAHINEEVMAHIVRCVNAWNDTTALRARLAELGDPVGVVVGRDL